MDSTEKLVWNVLVILAKDRVYIQCLPLNVKMLRLNTAGHDHLAVAVLSVSKKKSICSSYVCGNFNKWFRSETPLTCQFYKPNAFYFFLNNKNLCHYLNLYRFYFIITYIYIQCQFQEFRVLIIRKPIKRTSIPGDSILKWDVSTMLSNTKD